MSGVVVRVLCMLLVLASACAHAFAEGTDPYGDKRKKVALVIGEAAYRRQPLKNTIADARLVAGELELAGFAVRLAENQTLDQLRATFESFLDDADGADIAAVYYAGVPLLLALRFAA